MLLLLALRRHRQADLSWRPAWSTKIVLGQPGIPRETLFKDTRKKKERKRKKEKRKKIKVLMFNKNRTCKVLYQVIALNQKEE